MVCRVTRRFRWIVVLGSLAVLAGCSARGVPAGDAIVYKNSVISTLMLAGIGAAFLVFGIGITNESRAKREIQRRKSKKKKSISRSTATIKSTGSQGTAGIVIGLGLCGIGLAILLLGVPSSFLSYVTVAPDRVVLRDQLMWFSTAPKEFLFSSISDIDHEIVKQLARRGVRNKEYLFIAHAGGVERIEMGMIHKAARPRLEKAYAAFRSAESKGPISPDDTTIANAASPPVMPNPSADLNGAPLAPMTGPNNSATADGVSIPPGMRSPQTTPSAYGRNENSAAATTPNSDGVPAEDSRLVPPQPRRFRGKLNQTFSARVTGRTQGSIWGTDIYTDDSNLAVAVVHAGVLREGETGIVTFRILPGQNSYVASNRNGISSGRWGPYQGSYQIVSADSVAPATAKESDAMPAQAATVDGAELTPVDSIGRYTAGTFVMARTAGRFFRAEVIQVYEEKKVRVRIRSGPSEGEEVILPFPEAIPAASAKLAQRDEGPSHPVNNGNELQPGQSVLAHYDGRWVNAKVVGLRLGRAVIQWEGEQGQDAVPLSWLRIPE